MKLAYFAFALALLSISARAQDKKDAAPQSSASVLINGKAIEGKVLEIDGKHYVAVEDLAQSLRGTIRYGDGQIAITFSQPSSMAAQTAASQLQPAATYPPTAQPQSSNQPPTHQPSPTAQSSPSPMSPVAAPSPSQLPSENAHSPESQPPPVSTEAPETGAVKGTLTYFFDFHVGNKPDTGSKVWLVKGSADIPADQNFVATSTALGTSGNPEEYSAIKYSVADENGNFRLQDIPPGQYTLILQSAHTKGTLKEKRSLFSRGNGHNPRDANGRVEFRNLVIKPGETVDASKDFGPDIGM
ncbi:MAG: hypothetical protein ACRD4Y_16960 [Candidatus Acidiferrales bacterium]